MRVVDAASYICLNPKSLTVNPIRTLNPKPFIYQALGWGSSRSAPWRGCGTRGRDYTRPLLTSTRAVSDTKHTLNTP